MPFSDLSQWFAPALTSFSSLDTLEHQQVFERHWSWVWQASGDPDAGAGAEPVVDEPAAAGDPADDTVSAGATGGASGWRPLPRDDGPSTVLYFDDAADAEPAAEAGDGDEDGKAEPADAAPDGGEGDGAEELPPEQLMLQSRVVYFILSPDPTRSPDQEDPEGRDVPATASVRLERVDATLDRVWGGADQLAAAGDAADVPPFEFAVDGSGMTVGTLRIPDGAAAGLAWCAYRIVAEAPAGFSVRMASDRPFHLVDEVSLLQQRYGVSVTEAKGTIDASAPAAWKVLFRHKLCVGPVPSEGDDGEAPAAPEADAPEEGSAEAQPASQARRAGPLACQLHISDPEIRPYVTLLLSRGDEPAEALPFLGFSSRVLEYGDTPYTLVAVLQNSSMSAAARDQALPASSWHLRLSTESDCELRPLADLNSATGECARGDEDAADEADEATWIRSRVGVVEDFTDAVVPNKYFRLFRDVLSSGTADPASGAVGEKDKKDKKKDNKKKKKDDHEQEETGDATATASLRLTFSDQVCRQPNFAVLALRIACAVFAVCVLSETLRLTCCLSTCIARGRLNRLFAFCANKRRAPRSSFST